MKILLVTMGGAIDTVASVIPHPDIQPDRSQALHSLYRLSEDRPQTDEIDHVIIGAHGAKTVDSAAMTALADLIKTQAAQFERVVVTLPAQQAQSVAYSLSRYIFKVPCPVVLTGAERPYPKDFPTNALSNLKLAAFGHAYALPMIYFAEGEKMLPGMPEQTDFQRSHPIRTKLFWRPHYPPLGKTTAQPREKLDR